MTDFAPGFFAPWIIYAVILLLHLALPARKVEGYVADPETGRPLRYRLNGPAVLAVMVLLWVLLGRTGVFAWDWLWTHRWSGLIGSFALGVIFSFAVVLPAPRTGRSFLADFYFGRWENPQWFGRRVDAKMFLYLIGAVMLGLNLLRALVEMRGGTEAVFALDEDNAFFFKGFEDGRVSGKVRGGE